MLSVLRNLFANRPVSSSRPHSTQLCLESLEARALLSTIHGAIGGLSYTFEYNEQNNSGTLIIQGTSGNDNFALQEEYINANPGEPGYGDNRPVGINIVLQGGNQQGGVSFAPGANIRIVVNAGAGNDTVVNATRFDSTLNGEVGNDLLVGGTGNDVLDAGTGNDTLRGGDGHDVLIGGAGNDLMFGENGNDTLWGDDRVWRNGRWVSGSAVGNDQMVGGLGDDVLYGGLGDDMLFGDYMKLTHVGNGNYRWVSVTVGGNDQLFGEGGQDILVGGVGNDLLEGGEGEDWLFGGAGNDTLRGGAANDHLYGGNGNDHLDGGAGHNYTQADGHNEPWWYSHEWSNYQIPGMVAQVLPPQIS